MSAAVAEDVRLVLSAHISLLPTACNSSSRGLVPSSGFCGPCTHVHIFIHRHACIIKQETSLFKNIDTDCPEKSVTQQSWATLLLSEFMQ